MELSRMAMGIINMVDHQYSEYIDDECIDIIQIKNICNLYKIKSSIDHSLSLSEINLSSPEFKKAKTKSSKKNQANILKSQEFIKKYTFLIKILYSCLKLDIELFDVKGNILTLKNNYQLIKSIESKKKQLISEHLNILRNQHKNVSQKISDDYDSYVKNYVVKIKIIDRVLSSIDKLIRHDIFEKTDNLLTLILPYFYTYTEFIEEYA